uniref:Uncharacterized protein n=1 Tax=Chromera velia CCMP2878 TaxID=1169474 RepID=A0A0G4H3D8_9ALVE|eukprot:Cvel_24540.t1-p1 / transcript=Cvel_24540.t1 / gene=Cvel_24540 / organism=Chromera_velia_CCMP2878 / gene_product=hypothetical protein / transcript_product=hypothetical protein / location=Cvel_scaffold2665:1569-2410(+) / protein_length=235 / sequence_SO=supercontig / SO=protein_coding / is_pseudo=false
MLVEPGNNAGLESAQPVGSRDAPMEGGDQPRDQPPLSAAVATVEAALVLHRPPHESASPGTAESAPPGTAVPKRGGAAGRKRGRVGAATNARAPSMGNTQGMVGGATDRGRGTTRATGARGIGRGGGRSVRGGGSVRPSGATSAVRSGGGEVPREVATTGVWKKKWEAWIDELDFRLSRREVWTVGAMSSSVPWELYPWVPSELPEPPNRNIASLCFFSTAKELGSSNRRRHMGK